MLTPTQWAIGATAALSVGFAKTGVPGAGMAAVALMAELYHHHTQWSVGALVPLLVVGDLFAIAYYRRHANWRRLGMLAPWVVIGMAPGYLVLWYTESEPLRQLIGVVILLLLALHLGRHRLGLQHVHHARWFTAVMGGLAGFGTVVGNAAGPAMSIYLVSQEFDKHEFLGTSAWFYFLVNTSKIPLHLYMHVMTVETMQLDLFLVPLLAVGAFLGVYVHRRISQSAFDLTVLLLAALAGLQMVLR